MDNTDIGSFRKIRQGATANAVTIVGRPPRRTPARGPPITSGLSRFSVVPIGDIRCLPAIASAKAGNPLLEHFQKSRSHRPMTGSLGTAFGFQGGRPTGPVATAATVSFKML